MISLELHHFGINGLAFMRQRDEYNVVHMQASSRFPWNIAQERKYIICSVWKAMELDQEWGCAEAGEVLKKNSVPDWPLLAIYLISEASLMGSSRWSNYISALPRQPYSLLYCFSFQDTCRTGQILRSITNQRTSN